jgi:hypothetical protein
LANQFLWLERCFVKEFVQRNILCSFPESIKMLVFRKFPGCSLRESTW